VRGEVYLAAHRVKHAHARTIFINTKLQQELSEYIANRYAAIVAVIFE
jgi:integrase/recombinase XerD